jgi:hypothetical protein
MADAKATQAAVTGKGKRGVKGTRQERGLPELTPNQRMVVKIIQQAENACKLLKQSADKAEPIKADVLAACSTLSTALSGMLGAE